MEKSSPHKSKSTTWWVVFALLVVILVKGFYAFFLIGDRGQPTWDYRPLPDVPSQSAYAIYPKSPTGQHVRGPRGK